MERHGWIGLVREGQLTTNEKLKRAPEQETPEDQARRVFEYSLKQTYLSSGITARKQQVKCQP